MLDKITDSKVEGNHVEQMPLASLRDLRLLQRLRALDLEDYKAQYFDNKPEPRGETYRKMGNPSVL